MFWHNVTTPLIVERTLKSAIYSTDGEDIRLIEVRNGLGVLALPVFNDEIQRGVVGVYWKTSSGASVSAGVSAQKVESMFTKRRRPEDAIADVDDVRFIPSHGRLTRYGETGLLFLIGACSLSWRDRPAKNGLQIAIPTLFGNIIQH